ncbi:MAG: PIG-L deacetylase family protein [Limisphaerales bacterium]
MKLHNLTTDLFVPDGTSIAAACQRVTHLGIGAHQDDLEFMAFHGILECYGRKTKSFGGVTCTNGAGSARTGPFAKFTDAQMVAARRDEQRKAAVIGKFGVMIQLDHPSRTIKNSASTLKHDLLEILRLTGPQVVYTHNLADKHDTHLAVAMAAMQAMRELPRNQRPKRVIGCEGWRNLDWLADTKKVIMDVSGQDDLAAALNGVFRSQIAGGKRYDLATIGRRAANATFFQSHAADKATRIIFGMDLTPLVADESKDIVEYVASLVREFENDVRKKLSGRLGR